MSLDMISDLRGVEEGVNELAWKTFLSMTESESII